MLSFFPGLGHLYLGLYQRAAAFFLAFAFSIWLADHSDLGIVIAFVWFFAVIDAYRQAQLLNMGLAAEPLISGEQRVKAARRGNLGFGVFLLIVGLVLLYNQFYPIDFSFLEDWWPLLLVVAGHLDARGPLQGKGQARGQVGSDRQRGRRHLSPRTARLSPVVRDPAARRRGLSCSQGRPAT